MLLAQNWWRFKLCENHRGMQFRAAEEERQWCKVTAHHKCGLSPVPCVTSMPSSPSSSSIPTVVSYGNYTILHSVSNDQFSPLSPVPSLNLVSIGICHALSIWGNIQFLGRTRTEHSDWVTVCCRPWTQYLVIFLVPSRVIAAAQQMMAWTPVKVGDPVWIVIAEEERDCVVMLVYDKLSVRQVRWDHRDIVLILF